MKRMSVNIDKILSSISPSYKSGGIVNDLDLNKVQLLQLRQVKWIKAILKSEKLLKNVRSEFLQNLKAVQAIAQDLSKSEDDSRERTDEESSDNESGDEEGSGEGRSDESSDEDFEEQEMMTVEQAELMEQYVNGDL